jgi:hypothetical protein
MDLTDFREMLRVMTWKDFERFIVEVLRSIGRFSHIEQGVRMNIVRGLVREFDIVATETNPIDSPPRKWFFEVKKRDMISVDVIDNLAGRFPSLLSNGQQVHQVIVTSGSLTKTAQIQAENYGIEVWDAEILANLASPEVIKTYFGRKIESTDSSYQEKRKSDAFIETLQSTTPGKKLWSDYQRLSSDIFEYLFCPPLEPPRYNIPDAESRNIRDMIVENSATTGFWHSIRTTCSAHYIVVDAKNYTDQIGKKPVLDIAHYLKPYGCGMFGILFTRKGSGSAAEHCIREQWIGAQKMIIVLSDADIVEMLSIKASSGKPEELVRKKIADFRMAL